MKKLIFLIILILSLVTISLGQTSTSRIRTGSSLPASCSPNGNNVFFLTTGTVGIYQCTATDTWNAAGSVTNSGGGLGHVPAFSNASNLQNSDLFNDFGATVTSNVTFVAPIISITSQASDPSSADGYIWYNSTSHKFRAQQNGAVQDLIVSGAGTGDFSTNTSTSVANELVLFADTTGKLGKRASSTGIANLTSGVLGVITTSAGLAGALSDETGSGAAVFGTSPTISAPTISGHPVVEGVTSTGATGTGKFVFDGTPTLVTPVLGVATATSINKVAITAPASSATLTITDGKTASFSNTITFAGTDSTTMTFPEASRNIGMREAVQNSQSAAYTTVLADSGKSIYHPSADTTARTFTIDSNANVAYPIGTTITFINDCSAGTLTIAITSDTLVLAGTGSTGSRTLAACGMATAIKVASTRWIINGTGLT